MKVTFNIVCSWKKKIVTNPSLFSRGCFVKYFISSLAYITNFAKTAEGKIFEGLSLYLHSLISLFCIAWHSNFPWHRRRRTSFLCDLLLLLNRYYETFLRQSREREFASPLVDASISRVKKKIRSNLGKPRPGIKRWENWTLNETGK